MLEGKITLSSRSTDYKVTHRGFFETKSFLADTWELRGQNQVKYSASRSFKEAQESYYDFDNTYPPLRDDELRRLVEVFRESPLSSNFSVRVVAGEETRIVETEQSTIGCRFYKESLAALIRWPTGSTRRYMLTKNGTLDGASLLSVFQREVEQGQHPLTLQPEWKLLIDSESILYRLENLFCSSSAISNLRNLEFSPHLNIVDSGVDPSGVAFRPFDDAGIARLTELDVLSNGKLVGVSNGEMDSAKQSGNRFISKNGLFHIRAKGLYIVPIQDAVSDAWIDTPSTSDICVHVDVIPQLSINENGTLTFQIEGCPVYQGDSLLGHIPHAQLIYEIDEILGKQLDRIVADKLSTRALVSVGSSNIVN